MPTSLPVEFTERVVYSLIEAGFMRAQAAIVMEFGTRLDAARMARALRLLADCEPILGCRFVAAATPPVWERVEDIDEFLLVQSRDSNDFAGDSAVFVTEPFDPVLGPQLRALILTGQRHDALVLAVSCLAVDACGLKEAAYLLGGIYAKLAHHRDWEPVPDSRGVRNTEPMIKDVKIRHRFKALRPQDLFPPTDWGVRGTNQRGMPVYVQRDIEPTTFGKLVRYGRAHDATLSELLLAAYHRSLRLALRPAPLARTPVQLAYDLRGLMPSDTKVALANLSVPWTLRLQDSPGDTFAETLEQVVEQILEWRQSGGPEQMAVGVALADRLVRTKGADELPKRDSARQRVSPGRGYPILANAGAIDATRVDFGPAEHVRAAYVLGPIALPSNLIVTASLFCDRLRLTAGIDRKATDVRLAQAITDGTAAELESVAV